MPYIPHTEDDIRLMLEALGKKDIKDLFSSMPSKYRLKENGLDLPAGLSEYEAREKVSSLADRNNTASSKKAFLGAGAYYHHIPSAVNHVVMRSEFKNSL